MPEEFFGGVDSADASSSASGDGFEEDREADFFAPGECVLLVGYGSGASGYDGALAGDGGVFCFGLVAHGFDGGDGGADELDSHRLEGFGEA